MKAWNWAEIDSDEREYWSIPSKDVFQFMFHLKNHKQNKVYDLGCGIGRNLFFLMDMGFEVYGSDYSPDAVSEVNKRLCENRVKHESMIEITELDKSYDAVIACNVVYHAYLSDMVKALENIHRILKPLGSLLITFQSRKSPSYKKELEVEPWTIVKNKGNEKDIPHHYVDRDEIFLLLSDYDIVELSYIEHEYDNLNFKGCHYVVTAMKK